uniref:(northern house mosquito) hypothetical protein n=1 Tax=Culex pipiens TaxID=7175 RepID=A0A8D8IYV5_CULPI
MPARRPNWGSFQADGLLTEVTPLKSVKIGNGITIVAHCLGTFAALVWSHSGSGMNLSPHQDLSRRRVEEKSQNLQDEENFRRASSELSLAAPLSESPRRRRHSPTLLHKTPNTDINRASTSALRKRLLLLLKQLVNGDDGAQQYPAAPRTSRPDRTNHFVRIVTTFDSVFI